MRKQYSGTAPLTTLTVGVDDDAGTLTLVCADLAGWPLGGTAPFVATIGRNTTLEEKVLVNTRVSNTLNLVSRGYDGTSRRAHLAGATIEHTIDAATIDEVNRLANLATITGQIIVFNGTVFTVLSPGADWDVLMSMASDTNDIGWHTSLIEIASAPPAVVNGRSYYDTTLHAFFVGQGGAWRPAGRGAFVFANEAARNAFWGNPGPEGVISLTSDTNTVWIATSTEWRRIIADVNQLLQYADATARDAALPSPGDGQVVFLTAEGYHTKYRLSTDEWFPTLGKVTVGGSAPVSMVIGDLWFEEA